MSRLTLAAIAARVRRGCTKYLSARLKSEKTLLNLALLCVIHSVAELFLSKFLLHILGQTKRQILQRKYFAYI